MGNRVCDIETSAIQNGKMRIKGGRWGEKLAKQALNVPTAQLD
jgi:hypothetical protein